MYLVIDNLTLRKNNDIKDLKEIRFQDVAWIHQSQDRGTLAGSSEYVS